jgi:carbamate kinase
MMEDAGRGWRRVVASPRPIEIIEEASIRALLERDTLVVAAGGGGVPVIRNANGSLEGIAAVIDKDLASSLLARNLGAEMLIISTAVDKVALNFGTDDQQNIDQMTIAEALRYLDEGQFAPGSMRPKIEASIEFLEAGGNRVIITQPHLLEQATKGEAGTHIIP